MVEIGGGMYYQMNEDFLAHYGVLGMKWGRRKQKVSKAEKTRTKQLKKLEKKRDRWAKSAKEDRENAKKISKMSDSDYIKKTIGYDINTEKGMKKFNNLYGNPNAKTLRKDDIKYLNWSAKKSEELSKSYNKVYNRVKNMKVSDIDTKSSIKKKVHDMTIDEWEKSDRKKH